MRVFRYADYRESPWKNGGGITREIARAIDDGPDFLWRLSLADVHRSGPFSLFPGHERTIMLVEGDGIRLSWDSGQGHDLVTPHELFDFNGNAEVTCTLLGSPSTVLNLMVRRDHAPAVSHVMSLPSPAFRMPLKDGHVHVVVCLSCQVVINPLQDDPTILERWDAAICGEMDMIECRDSACFLSVEVFGDPIDGSGRPA